MQTQKSNDTARLREIITNQQPLSIFAGSALSANAGFPSWQNLVSQMAEQISYELPPPQWIESQTIREVTQAYVNEFGLHNLVSLLKNRLDMTKFALMSAHYALAQLPVSLVFTASYDDLLERAYREAGKRVEVIVTDGDIPFIRQGPDVVNIVKIFGALSQPKTLILTQEQYESFFLDRPQLVKLLETELARSTFLYLGWDHTDPHFNLIFGETLARYQRFMRPGYAVMEAVTEAQRAEFRRKQIRVIELPADTEEESAVRLATWLTAINPQLSPTQEGEAQSNGPKSGQDNGDSSDPPEPINNSGQAWAVLVGVNHYEDEFIHDLSVCVQDVASVYGHIYKEYQSAKLLNDAQQENLPTRANILAALSTAAQLAEEGDLLLFYFSGHGETDGDQSYLLPRDARISAIAHTGVAMRDIHTILEKSAARALVIILDACHSGAAIGKSTAMSDEFIQRVFAEAEGSAVLASCKQGQKSYQWPSQQKSVFTHYLLEALQGQADFDKKGFVTLSDLNRYVVDGVKRWSVDNNLVQTPTLQYRVAGDIVLLQNI